jgi:hypothetical protein
VFILRDLCALRVSQAVPAYTRYLGLGLSDARGLSLDIHLADDVPTVQTDPRMVR